jgi:S-(hydroxymethyl)glutathione dehydrogenase / alcohol dehydrogenase
MGFILSEHDNLRAMNTSRRDLMKAGVAFAQVGTLAAQTSTSGKKFRGWVSRGTGPGRTTLQELTLRPISGRQVVVRTEATNLCYSNCPPVLGLNGGGGGALGAMALIQGHGGVGVVESVGPDVRRVQAGDRVCVSGTPQCGNCYQCLRGRADMCQFLGRQGPKDLVPIADMRDGTPVYANSHIGGLAEYMVTFEEWVVPVFTKASAVDLGMVCSCVSVAGLGCTASQGLAAIAPASTVAVVGCGPLGLSAIQGARIAGASMIIAIDPIRARRDVALKVGATHVLDPNVEGEKLVDKVRQMTSGPTDRFWAGGRDSGGLLGGAGADFVVEAVGAEHAKPKLESGPDPTGIVPMQQAYMMCAPGGHVITTSLPRGNISLPAVVFAIGGRTHHAGQAGGASPMRDIPRFVEMLDKGQYDAKALATTVVPLEKMLEGYEEVLYRSTVTGIMVA